MICAKSGNDDLVIFRPFFNFKVFLGPFLGTVVKDMKALRLLLISIFLISHTKNLSINIGVPKIRFSK